MSQGQTIEPRSIDVTLDGMRRYSGPGRNIHTDQEKAEAIGMPEPIAAGALMQAFISEWLFSSFGEAWYESGTMSITFVDIVLPGDELVLDGDVTESRDGGMEIDIECYVDEGGDDRTTIVGSASIGADRQ